MADILHLDVDNAYGVMASLNMSQLKFLNVLEKINKLNLKLQDHYSHDAARQYEYDLQEWQKRFGALVEDFEFLMRRVEREIEEWQEVDNMGNFETGKSIMTAEFYFDGAAEYLDHLIPIEPPPPKKSCGGWNIWENVKCTLPEMGSYLWDKTKDGGSFLAHAGMYTIEGRPFQLFAEGLGDLSAAGIRALMPGFVPDSITNSLASVLDHGITLQTLYSLGGPSTLLSYAARQYSSDVVDAAEWGVDQIEDGVGFIADQASSVVNTVQSFTSKLNPFS